MKKHHRRHTRPDCTSMVICVCVWGFITITMSYHINVKLLKVLHKASRRLYDSCTVLKTEWAPDVRVVSSTLINKIHI